MARQIINIGTSPNKGDGDPLRIAFDKVNDNFIEVYRGPQVLTQEEIDLLTPSFGFLVYNSTVGKFQGYAEDSGDSTPGWVDLH